MIPLRDDIPTRTAPFMNYAVIGLTTLVFFAQLREDPRGPSLIEKYGMIPLRITKPGEPVEIPVGVRQVMTEEGPRQALIQREAAPSAVPPVLTMLTCIFLHGGWMHFLGNMWFLHIFGDNVEDRFGHVGYLVFYLACGAAASLTHYVTEMYSSVPTIGASGAIAGVMGAYFVSYPRAHVMTLLPLLIIWQIIVLPAAVFLGIWFLIQFLQGTLVATAAEATGVAWWAHIGGFAAGAGATWLLDKAHLIRTRNRATRAVSDMSRTYRIHAPRRPW